MRRLSLFVLLLMVLPAATARAQRCGVERWPVKTGTDRDVSRIDLDNPRTVTINDLRQIHGGKAFARSTLQRRGRTRISPEELQTFTLDATLIAYKREGGRTGDSDYHLVLEDDSCPRGRSCTVVVEIPLASCVATAGGTGENRRRILEGITQSRRDFDEFVARDKPRNLNIARRFRVTSTPVRVSGVGFFDFDHGQRGRAPNIFEIHPVLRITFR